MKSTSKNIYLTGYYKCQVEEEDSIAISIVKATFSDSKTVLEIKANLILTNNQNTYKAFSLPFDLGSDLDSTFYIRLKSHYTLNENEYSRSAKTMLIIDDLLFTNEPLALEEEPSDMLSINVSPNPSTGVLRIHHYGQGVK